MEAALLIASLTLLFGMLSQLALLPRRQRARARRIQVAAAAGGGETRGWLRVAEQTPAVD